MLRVAAPWLMLAVALAVAGGVVYAVSDGMIEALSIGLFGVAAVVAVSAVFYAVGTSEDRDRDRGA